MKKDKNINKVKKWKKKSRNINEIHKDFFGSMKAYENVGIQIWRVFF